MEPRRQDHSKSREANPTQRPKRFHILKLEERIAPRRKPPKK